MSATFLYRVAALVFVVTAVGHTYGILSLRGPSPEGRAVYDSMNSVHFRGLGLSGTVSTLFLGYQKCPAKSPNCAWS